MPNKFVKFSFSAGVLSESLLGRSDIEKADLGVKQADNFIIDYRGGAFSRAGFEFGDFIQGDPDKVRFENFNFNSAVGNNYVMVVGAGYIRFVQGNAYVLEDPIGIDSLSNVNGLVATDASHGFSTGDLVKLQGLSDGLQNWTFEISVGGANEFTLLDPNGDTFDFTGYSGEAGGSSATVARVYTVETPYAEEDLHKLTFHQYRDEVRITHQDYPPYKLTRLAQTNWTFEEIDFSGTFQTPWAVTANYTSASAGVVYGITAVNARGEESLVQRRFIRDATNISVTPGSIELTWARVTDALYYNIYRSLFFPTGTQVTGAATLGFIGRATAPQFIDNNIIADFTKSPPEYYNPFVSGGIIDLQITNGGSGYTNPRQDITVSDSGATGSGFLAEAHCDDSGAIIGFQIRNYGKDYSGTLTFSVDGPGSGETITGTIAPTSGVYPRTVTRFNQRTLYAGTGAQPMTLFGSRPNMPEGFFQEFFVTATSPLILDLDAPEVDPIKHAVPLTNSLFVFTESSIHRVRGSDDAALTPLSGLAEPVVYAGAADVAPLPIDQGFLYVQGKGASVKSIEQGDGFSKKDLSIFSNDFFSSSFPIESWAFAEDPNRLVWAQRTDGVMLALAYVPEQNVYAWTPLYTKGDFKAVTVVQENLKDRVYTAVRRKLNGKYYCTIERLAIRDVSSVEEMWSVDAALRSSRVTPAANLTIAAGTGSGVAVTASASVFSSGDVGKHLRVHGGRAVVATYVSGTAITVNWEIDASEIANGSTPESPVYDLAPSGTWSLDALQTEWSGFDHLNGETIQVFADGDYAGDYLVENGTITLDEARSYILGGIGFTSTLETLPLFSAQNVLQDELKMIYSVSLRLFKSRGLEVGKSTFYTLKDRTDEAWSEPTRFLTGYYPINVGVGWDRDGTFKVRRTTPTFVSVLGYVIDADLSDDN